MEALSESENMRQSCSYLTEAGAGDEAGIRAVLCVEKVGGAR